MRKRFLLIVIAFSSLGLTIQAQEILKIGYVDLEFVLSNLSEIKKVQSELDAINEQLQKQLQSMYLEYEQKLQAYEESLPTILDPVRQEKELELTQLQQRIQNFQSEAQISLQERQSELMKPLYDRISKAIEVLATEEGFTHILNKQIGNVDIVLYSEEKFDISDKVLQKMGND